MSRTLRILDFDIENRPLSYWIPDRPSAEITAIAWKFVGDKRQDPRCVLLRATDGERERVKMLTDFIVAYDMADIVLGQYIRKHDLPIINGALLEHNLPSLSQKLTIDTKLDLKKEKDMPVSQENLGDMLGVTIDKVHMTQADWREANRLTPVGLRKTKKRVTTDVRQNILIYQRLVELDWLKPPRMWRP